MTETDSGITRGYRGYNAGTRDYDSITKSYGSITRSYRREREGEREGVRTIGLD